MSVRTYRTILHWFRLSKKGCILIAFIFFTMTLLISFFQSQEDKQKIYYDTISTLNSNYLSTITSPHLRGINQKKQFYDVTAQSSHQINDNEQNLYVIHALIEQADGSLITIKSDEGIYDKSKSSLILIHNVDVKDDQNKHFKTEKAHINLINNVITCLAPALIFDQDGNQTKAAGCKITDDGNKIHFTGPIQSVTKQKN